MLLVAIHQQGELEKEMYANSRNVMIKRLYLLLDHRTTMHLRFSMLEIHKMHYVFKMAFIHSLSEMDRI